MIEIRFHARGGQGAVTAARLLAQAAFMEGKHSTAIPFFGAERRGAPVVSFCRVSDEPIKISSAVCEPDFVVVFDARLINADVIKGLKKDGTVIINSQVKVNGFISVDASGIARSLGLVRDNIPMVNTAMLGALARFEIVSLKSVKSAIKETFDERNAIAAEQVYREIIL
ncbi:MAG TPA: pyruvate ferredoxin oxidoreductase [Candidatus Methanoperedenaceae archaeon]|nr:pyruvate ferredoxin oxidoreductase [Candidatus Methanoperedenaceae archaeon]